MIRVLISSDYPVVRAGLRAILEPSADLLVAGESNAADLSALSLDVRPDIVLLELSRTEQGWTEILSRLLPEMPDLGVVALSDDAGEALAREALQSGVRGYLLRDASPEEVLETIRAVHQGLTVLHPATARVLLPQQRRPRAVGEADSLSEREIEVLQLLAQGLPSKTIAARLSISEHTVKFHVGSILAKLGAASRTEAVSLALRRGLISL